MSNTHSSDVWGYARPSAARPLPPQLQALRAAGVSPERTLVDDSPIRRHRPKLEYFRAEVTSGAIAAGSVLVVATLDRLGLTVREMAALVRELHEHGIGVRALDEGCDVDTTPPLTQAGGLVLALLALVEQAEAAYTNERVEVTRAAADRDGRKIGRARQVDPETVAQALRLYDDGVPVAEIEQRVNISRTSFYRLAAAQRGGPVGVRRRRRPGLPAETRAALLALKGQTSARRAAALHDVAASTVQYLWTRADTPLESS